MTRAAGTKRVARLEENVGALDVELTSGELARIEAVSPLGVAAGPRYEDMSWVSR